MALFPASERQQPLQPHGVAKWALSSRIFHWVSVVLLVITWAMIELNDDAVDDSYLDLHKAFGVSILCWTLARLINRLVTKDPYTVPMPKWQTGLAHLTHLLLYFLLIAMPIAGLLTVMYSGEGVNMFGLFEIPSFVAQNSDMEHLFEKIHKDILWTLLMVFTGLHVVGALYHQFISKDGLIKRMF